jgi:hypothetical protein
LLCNREVRITANLPKLLFTHHTVPHIPLYVHRDKNKGLAATSEAVRLIQEKYLNEAPPSGDTVEDEKRWNSLLLRLFQRL